jgi:hypothetical protein
LPVFIWHLGRIAIRRFHHRPTTFRPAPLWLWLAGATLLLFSVLRNLPFPAFAWMRP